MPDIPTRSFCERCGSAHSLEPAAGRTLPGLARLPHVARGLRNYVLSDQPLSDALALARLEEADALAARQVEAFRRTFRFCLSCRQYVCTDCWNADAGQCATCAPLPLPAVATLDAGGQPAASGVPAVAPEQTAMAPTAEEVELLPLEAVPAELVAEVAGPTVAPGAESAEVAPNIEESPPVPVEEAEPILVIEAVATRPQAVTVALSGPAGEATLAPSAETSADVVPAPAPEPVAAEAAVTVAEPSVAESAAEEPPAAAEPVLAAAETTAAPPETAASPRPLFEPVGQLPLPYPWQLHPPVIEMPLATTPIEQATPPARAEPSFLGSGLATCPACALRLSRAARFCRRCGTPQASQAVGV